MRRNPPRPDASGVLLQLRGRIDALDTRLLRLLNQRAALALRVGRLKKRQGLQLFDPRREQAILRRLMQANGGPLSPQAVRAIYREVLTQVRRFERCA